ncbi:E1 ubiquitin-activating protein uba2 [Microbotryomycetes sp. JL221]|nr:E1 ubiquitin-activating protein uba2 [Microbotryomycetes sp. JL221]
MTPAPQDRYAHSRAVLGQELLTKVQDARVLVVGAGGIGCELIKNMVMSGFGASQKGMIELLDLDTIDLSNLNRQFLFQKQHVKRPKAVVARETALKFNPDVNIKALHRNIKDAEFDVDYFKSFDFVMNALDNLDARRHVNKMCLAADIPLIESGTQGYVGQVQPIKKDVTECFDCTPKPVPKTFAVCTIRSTPSTAHHCIAWAKSYLFPQLFGADDENEGNELDEAEKNGENADEIKELRKEAEANRELRASLTQQGSAQRVFEKVYEADIQRLLHMEDMWKHRKPPHVLSYKDLLNQSKQKQNSNNVINGLKDQQTLSLVDSFELFLKSVEKLSERIKKELILNFDKDDDDTLDFVTSAANLRASAFDIETQTRFQVKEYAGNIIPAIATTNAIIAGVLVLQALNVLRNDWKQSKMVWLARQPTRVFQLSPLPLPNPRCAACRVVYVPIRFKQGCKDELTLGQFVEQVVINEVGLNKHGHLIILNGNKIIFETEDLEENVSKTLSQLEIKRGTFLNVFDDDENFFQIQFCIGQSLNLNSKDLFKIETLIPKPLPLKQELINSDVDSDNEGNEKIQVGLSKNDGVLDVTKEQMVITGQKRSRDQAQLEEQDEIQQNGNKKTKSTKNSSEVIVLDDEETGVVTIDLT